MSVKLKGFLNSPLIELLDNKDFTPRTYNTIVRVMWNVVGVKNMGEFRTKVKVGHLFLLNEDEFRSNYGVTDKVIGELNTALSDKGVILF